MSTERELRDFVGHWFTSVWSLETALLMMRDPGQSWQQPALVAALRASELVVVKSLDELLAAGLVVAEQGDSLRYQPATADLERLMAELATLYASSPAAVRRSIVRTRYGSISAFSDAFKLGKGEQ
jgi:hypothetical protein